MKLSDEIAGSIDAGFICYVNPLTGEMEEFMEGDDLDIDLSEDESEEDDEPTWQKDVRKQLKEQLARVDSWEKFVIIRKPNSSEAFRFMENFVEDVIPESEQKMFWKALQWKKPFANFNDLIHDSDYLEDWYAFKQQKLMEYVREELGE